MRQQESNQRSSVPTGPFMRPSEAAKYLGLGLSTYYELAKSGAVPSPVKITPNGRASGVPKSLLDAFVQSRVTEISDAG